MSLPDGWRNHLIATGEAVHEMVERIERIAVAGRSPGNRRLAPLDGDDWTGIASGLARIEAEFESLKADLLPASERTDKENVTLTATRYHLSLALMSLEQEILAGINPDQPPKRGRLDAADKEGIRQSFDAMRADVAKLRSIVERIGK